MRSLLEDDLGDVVIRDELELPSDCTPLEGLVALYRNPRLPEGLRFKAMAEAAKYMHARIAVRADVSASFAERLEEVIQRRMAKPQVTNGMKVIEAKPSGVRRL